MAEELLEREFFVMDKFTLTYEDGRNAINDLVELMSYATFGVEKAYPNVRITKIAHALLNQKFIRSAMKHKVFRKLYSKFGKSIYKGKTEIIKKLPTQYMFLLEGAVGDEYIGDDCSVLAKKYYNDIYEFEPKADLLLEEFRKHKYVNDIHLGYLFLFYKLTQIPFGNNEITLDTIVERRKEKVKQFLRKK